MVSAVLASAHGLQLLPTAEGAAEVVSCFYARLEHGYPIPTLGREAALGRALPALAARGIASVGRFGAYRYEVSNQDHSFVAGMRAAAVDPADAAAIQDQSDGASRHHTNSVVK